MIKNILLTGGTGTFGTAFLKKYYNNKSFKITIFSRDEMKQWFLKSEIFKNASNFEYILGDIRDEDRINFACKNIDYIIHAAASKIVTMSEENPIECIKTNINGATNIITAASNNNVKKVLALSTDKACNPSNLYGATKLASDKLFCSANNLTKYKTKFAVVRYGNVINSRGSLIPFLKKLNDEKSPYFPITSKDMTRFFISIKDAISFVIQSMDSLRGGEIFVKKIPSAKIIDIASAINPNKKIKIIGIRPGEKLNEVMISEDDARNTLEFSDHYRIIPQSKLNTYKKKTNAKDVNSNFRYDSKSNKDWLSVEDLKALVENL